MSTEELSAPPPETPAEVSMAQVEELLRADEQAEHEEPEEAVEEAVEEKAEEAQEEAPRGDLRVALREERERRRQAEQVAQQERMKVQQSMAYQQQIAQQIAAMQQRLAPQQPRPQIPDFESDPAGALKYQVDVLSSAIGQMRQQEMARQQQAQFEAAQAQAEQAVVAQERAFVEQNKDYYDAVDFMRDKIKRRFETLGIPKEQLDVAVAQDMRQFALKALQAGANPAEKVFQLAKVEGYNGRADANSEKLSTIARGVAASRGARSSAPTNSGEFSMEEAVKMPYSEFLKKFGSEARWQKLMGG